MTLYSFQMNICAKLGKRRKKGWLAMLEDSQEDFNSESDKSLPNWSATREGSAFYGGYKPSETSRHKNGRRVRI